MLQDLRIVDDNQLATKLLFLPFVLSLLCCLFLRADWGRQFLTQSPQPVLYREPESFGRRQGHKARDGHFTEVAGKRCHQRIRLRSRDPSECLPGFGWDDRGSGLFLSRCLIIFFLFICLEINVKWGPGGADHIWDICIWHVMKLKLHISDFSIICHDFHQI